ncbi:aspartate/glutamate racemase family protein [Paraburkholderia sabiae]|uniref:Aspartate/glutamate racemase family protein n=1 Tax=Paraburkholderia sabiae TaxID=273251 RepID=A0ABU9QLD2_9BURK|nr:aspartate/glutamate racemase family protein [Paraburkholderia sabiae]WJZ79684.1 aspartate/glutamate racemase family protein [Paraburkholderia sabiae]
MGLILPSLNTTTEPDFIRHAPSDVGVFATRVFMKVSTPEDLRAMNAQVDDACRLIASIVPDVVVYACTSGTFLDGNSALANITSRIESLTDSRAVTTSAALLDALATLSVSKVAIAAPYPADVTKAECRFFESNGYKVVSSHALLRSGNEIRKITAGEIERLVVEADSPDAEAIVVSCTDLRAFELVQHLEEVVKKPVLTSNQATLWAVLKLLNRQVQGPAGALFRSRSR